MLEREVEKYLLKKVKEAGGLCYKFTSPSNRGVPDRCIIARGHTFFVEVKRPGGRLTKLQEHVIDTMRQAGADVFVTYSKTDVDVIVEYINELN